MKKWASADRRQVTVAALSNQNHSTRATAALQKLVETDPAFGSLSLWCKHRDAMPEEITLFTKSAAGEERAVRLNYDIALAFTDGETVWYGQDFEAWSLAEQMAVCAHEIMHIACRHVQRGKALAERLGAEYDPPLFNIAADAIINETLRRAGHTLPNESISMGRLLKEVLGRSERDSEKMLSEVDVETLYALLSQARELHNKSAQMLIAIGGGVLGDLFQRGGKTSSDALEEAEWSTRLRKALSVGAAAGRGIGTHAYNLADLPKPKVPWEIILRRLVTKTITHVPQESYARPQRRWLALDSEARHQGRPTPAFMPGQIASKGRARVVVCLDVSGSISKTLLRRFGAEITGISKRTGAELHLIIFDHGIQLNKRLRSYDIQSELSVLQFSGGGGTSFVEPIETALEQDPSIIVVMTDLEGPAGKDPRVPVIWATPSSRSFESPFGRTVSLDL